jgi:putative DNA primase/helicase
MSQSTFQPASAAPAPLPTAATIPGGIPENDTLRAERFHDWLEDSVRYVGAWKTWVIWQDDKGWEQDPSSIDGTAIKYKTIQFAKAMMEEAQSYPPGGARTAAIALATKLFGNETQNSMITVLKALPGVSVRPDQFDANPMLLGVQNGVVDLSTGKFREVQQDDMILKRCGVEYDPAAKCPMWREFQVQVQPDEAVRDFIQRAFGYTATGLTTEQVVFFAYGEGMNGKSTTFTIMHDLFGDFAWRASATLFLDSKFSDGDRTTTFASLPEKRFVIGAEMPENARLAEHRLKDLSGGESVQARKLFCEPFVFEPTHKLWFYGNVRPLVSGTNTGIWRRLLVLPYTVRIPDDKRDFGILERLGTEASGILNWVIEGALLWKKQGLNPPDAVRYATKEYRDEEDLIGQFIEEQCLMDGDIARGILASHFADWLKGQGNAWKMSARQVSSRVQKVKGVGHVIRNGTRFWTGISMKDEAAFRK